MRGALAPWVRRICARVMGTPTDAKAGESRLLSVRPDYSELLGYRVLRYILAGSDCSSTIAETSQNVRQYTMMLRVHGQRPESGKFSGGLDLDTERRA